MNSKQEYLIKKLKEAVEHDEYSNAVSYYDKALSFGLCDELDTLHEVIDICRKKSKEEKHLQDTYESAISLMRKNDEDSLNSAIAKFESLSSYRDSKQNIEKCKELLCNLKDKQEKQNKLIKKWSIISASAFAAIILVIVIITNIIVPSINFSKAVKLLESNDFAQADTYFSKLNSFYNSKIEKAYYNRAIELASNTNLTYFKKCQEQISSKKYIFDIDEILLAKCLEFIEKKDISKAEEYYALISTDDSERIREKYYEVGIDFFKNSKYEDAIKYLANAKTHKDAESLLKDCYYNIGSQQYSKGDYNNALSNLEKVSNYKDSANLIDDCNYQISLKKFNEQNYQEAIAYAKKSQKAKSLLDTIYAKCLSMGKEHLNNYANGGETKLLSQASDMLKLCDQSNEEVKKCLSIINAADSYNEIKSYFGNDYANKIILNHFLEKYIESGQQWETDWYSSPGGWIWSYGTLQIESNGIYMELPGVGNDTYDYYTTYAIYDESSIPNSMADYDIKNGIFSYNGKAYFSITPVNETTLKLYSYRSKRTYTFYNINSSFERKELP